MAGLSPGVRKLLWPILLLGCLGSAPLYAQPAESKPSSQPQPHAKESGEDSTRVVGIIPAFNTSDNVNAPALTSRQKFHLFSRTVTDPFNLIMPAVNAAILDSGGVSSGYGSGFGGLAKRYASSLADTTSGNFFRLYAYPALLHEDPRYFRAGEGSIGKRTKHVFGAVFITRKDDPSFRFNWSKLLASTSSAGLSNAYYPAENRGMRLTLWRIGLSYVTEIGTNALKEFWPDVAKKMRKNKDKQKSESLDASPSR
jgi:hypothetical protein